MDRTFKCNIELVFFNFFDYINMNYIIEAIFVGIYTCFIYFLFSQFITPFLI